MGGTGRSGWRNPDLTGGVSQGVIALLLPAQLLALTLSFDLEHLHHDPALWAQILGHASALPQIAIAAVAALAVLAGGRISTLARALADAHSTNCRRWLALLAQVSAFALHAATTLALLGPNRGADGAPWIAFWAATGLATVVLWALALADSSYWRTLLRSESRSLSIACGFGLLAWLAGRLAQTLWRPLARATFILVERQLKLVYSEVVADPATRVLGTPSFNVGIAPECSGLEGVGLVAVLMPVFLWLLRDRFRFPRAFALVPLAMVLIWLANSVRIAGLIIIGNEISEPLALQGFHSQAGWLALNGVTLGLLAVSLYLPAFTRPTELLTAETPVAPVDTAPGPTLAYLAPLLTLSAAIMVTGLLTAEFDWLYPLRALAGGLALWGFRHTYLRLEWAWSWAAVANGALVFVIWIALEPTSAPASSAFTSELAAAPAVSGALWLICRVLGSVIVVPLAEELAFRGYLIRRLLAVDFEDVPAARRSWPALLVSSVLFGLLHSRWLAGTIAGLLFGLAVYRRGRLSDAILAHAVANALVAAAALAGWWSLWG